MRLKKSFLQNRGQKVQKVTRMLWEIANYCLLHCVVCDRRSLKGAVPLSKRGLEIAQRHDRRKGNGLYWGRNWSGSQLITTSYGVEAKEVKRERTGYVQRIASYTNNVEKCVGLKYSSNQFIVLDVFFGVLKKRGCRWQGVIEILKRRKPWERSTGGYNDNSYSAVNQFSEVCK